MFLLSVILCDNIMIRLLTSAVIKNRAVFLTVFMSWKYFIKNYLSDTKGKCLAELCISIKKMSQFHSINVSVECRIQVQ